jgi:hypothetical protein
VRNAVSQAGSAEGAANNTANTLGGEAQGIGANLTPFLTSELEHPQGFSQGDTSAMLSAGLGGAGGANAGLVGQADQRAAVSRNAGGFQAALDDAARQRSKGGAMASENIASQNATLKQNQQQDAAKELGGIYGTDTSGMLQSQGQEASDINAETNASKTGWLQNTMGILGGITGGVNAYANLQRAQNGSS